MGPQRVASPHYTCTFPGCPSPVKVWLELISSLQAVVRQTDGDLQGVLHGVRTPNGTEVRSCRPVPAFSLEAMGRASAERDAVGYYRVRHADVMQLTDLEASISDTSFAKPGSVVLLVQRRDGVAHANFFFRENGALVNLPLLGFPLDARLLEDRKAAAPPPAPVPAPAVPAARPRADVVEPGRSWTTIGAGVLALAVGVGLGVWYMGHRGVPAEKVAVTNTAPSNATPLPLRAERQGEDLKVIWDLGSAQIANAVSGVLDIDDGGAKRRIPLDERQVRFGSVLYTPKSDEVSIDFTAVKPDGSAGQASVLVLMTRTATGGRSTQVRNVPAVPRQSQAADRKAAVALTRQFVPPPEKRAVAAPREEESLPSAELKRPAVASVQLPTVPAPAPPQPQRPAVSAAPTVQTQQQRSPATAPPVQRVEPPPTSSRPSAPVPSAEAIYYAPQLVSQVGARVPSELRSFLSRPFTVTVRATIDETGRVIHADAPKQNVVHVGFLAAATEAAMRCRFLPARRGNTPVRGEAILTFKFQ